MKTYSRLLLKNVSTAKINFYYVVIFLIVALSMNVFYLVDLSAIKIGSFSFADLDWISIVLLTLFIFVCYPKQFYKINYRFVFIEVGVILLALTSSFQAFLNYNQPLLLGIRAQREQIVYPFLFLCLDILQKRQKVKRSGIIKLIYIASIVEMTIGFLQIFLFDLFDFTYVLTNYRYGSARLYMSDSLIALSLFFSLGSFFEKKKFRYLIYILFCLLFFGVVTKGRMAFLTIIVSIIIVSFFFSKTNVKDKFVFLLTFSVVLIVVFNSAIGKDILEAITNNGDTSNALIRDIGRSYYLEVIVKHPLLGGGYVNILWPEAVEGSMYNKSIYWVDNGVFGYMFYYGILGLIFIFILYCVMFANSFKVYRLKNNSAYLGYCIYTFLGLYTLFLLGMKADLALPLFCFVLFSELVDTKRIIVMKGAACACGSYSKLER